MPKKRFSAEQIVTLLRLIEVSMAQDKSAPVYRSNCIIHACVYRILDSVWTQRTDGVSSRPDEGSVQADSRRTGFALQVESKAGSRNPDPTATDQCASPAGTEAT